MAPGPDHDRFRHLALALKGRATADAEQEVGAPFDVRVDSCLDLLEHGEAEVGFEILVSNIYEYAVEISAEEFRAVEQLAEAWAIPTEQWSYVRELVRD